MKSNMTFDFTSRSSTVYQNVCDIKHCMKFSALYETFCDIQYCINFTAFYQTYHDVHQCIKYSDFYETFCDLQHYIKSVLFWEEKIDIRRHIKHSAIYEHSVTIDITQSCHYPTKYYLTFDFISSIQQSLSVLWPSTKHRVVKIPWNIIWHSILKSSIQQSMRRPVTINSTSNLWHSARYLLIFQITLSRQHSLERFLTLKSFQMFSTESYFLWKFKTLSENRYSEKNAMIECSLFSGYFCENWNLCGIRHSAKCSMQNEQSVERQFSMHTRILWKVQCRMLHNKMFHQKWSLYQTSHEDTSCQGISFDHTIFPEMFWAKEKTLYSVQHWMKSTISRSHRSVNFCPKLKKSTISIS